MNYLHILGANVKAYRNRLNLTQEQLSKEAKINRAYICSIESGEKNISIKCIANLAKALKIEPYQLLKK